MCCVLNNNAQLTFPNRNIFIIYKTKSYFNIIQLDLMMMIYSRYFKCGIFGFLNIYILFYQEQTFSDGKRHPLTFISIDFRNNNTICASSVYGSLITNNKSNLSANLITQ